MKNWNTIMQRTLIVLAVVSVAIATQSAGDGGDVGMGHPKMSNCMQPHGMKSLLLFLMGMTPKCDENGDLLPLQCYDHSKHCVCVRKDGNIINMPSMSLKGCECLVRKHEEENSGMLGMYVPQCEADGTYMKRQCHYSTGFCYCADASTGQNTTMPTREDFSCD